VGAGVGDESTESCKVPNNFAFHPTIQHTAAEHRGLTTNTITVIEQLACKNKAFIIVLQETHCAQASDAQLLIGCVTVTFVHERLEWSLVDQSSEQSETEWLCVDLEGCQIIKVCKPPRLQLTPMVIPTFPHPSLNVGDFICQLVN